MGRTITSITAQLDIEEQSYHPFRRALRKSDQMVFDELFAAAKNHRAAAAMAANTLPMESMLLAMLIEERKEVKRLQDRISVLEATQRNC
jgi:hypothetical protein